MISIKICRSYFFAYYFRKGLMDPQTGSRIFVHIASVVTSTIGYGKQTMYQYISNLKINLYTIYNMPRKKSGLDDPAFKGVNFDGPPYICPRCGYSTPRIALIKNHLKKEKPCKNIRFDFICDCLEGFNDLKELNYHQERCAFLKKKNVLIQNMQNKCTINGDINNGTLKNITNNIITNNIYVQDKDKDKDKDNTRVAKIVAYNSVDKYTRFDDIQLNMFINSITDNDPYICYVKITYCYKNTSFFRSVYYPDKNSKSAYVYDGSVWIEKKINIIVHRIIDVLSEEFNKFITSEYCTDKKVCKKLKARVDEIYFSMKDEIDNNDIEERNELHAKIKDLLYINSGLIKNTYDVSRMKRTKNLKVLATIHNFSSGSSDSNNSSDTNDSQEYGKHTIAEFDDDDYDIRRNRRIISDDTSDSDDSSESDSEKYVKKTTNKKSSSRTKSKAEIINDKKNRKKSIPFSDIQKNINYTTDSDSD